MYTAPTDSYTDVSTLSRPAAHPSSAPGRLDSAYGFNFLYADKLTPALVRDAMADWPDTPGMGWPSWAFENHGAPRAIPRRSEEHTSDLQSLMRITYAVFCLQKKKNTPQHQQHHTKTINTQRT